MIQVSYLSKSPEPMTAEALLSLLNECRTNNRKNGVTGMLLYANGTFLQAIEGEEKVIDALLERIYADPRHAEIQMLHRTEIDRPQYADWSMGFDQVSNEALDEVEGLRDFGEENFNFDYLVGHGSVMDSLLDHYRQPNWDLVIGEIDAQKSVIQDLEKALSKARDRVALARLALESITEASRKGQPGEPLVELCESALDSLRPK